MKPTKRMLFILFMFLLLSTVAMASSCDNNATTTPPESTTASTTIYTAGHPAPVLVTSLDALNSYIMGETPPRKDPYSGPSFLLDSFLPSLAESRVLEFSSGYVKDSYFDEQGYYCAFSHYFNERKNVINCVDILVFEAPPFDDCDAEYYKREYSGIFDQPFIYRNTELQCVLVKDGYTLRYVDFYAYEGYRVRIDFSKERIAQQVVLKSDATELLEILENPTFSCKAIRTISEALAAMN